MKTVPIVLLLAALVACEDKPQAAANLPPLTLPVASQGVEDKGDDPHDRLIISVDEKGFVHFRGKKVTLDELGPILCNRKEIYNLKMRVKGKDGMEKLPGGGLASKLYVLLRADEDTPWQHVQWLMCILAESHLYKLQFAVRRAADTKAEPENTRLAAKMEAFLPRDDGILPIPGEPPQEIRLAVHIVARKEVPAKWGPDDVPVSKPTAFKYRVGDRTFVTLEPVRKWIGAAKKAAQPAPNAKVVGEILAGHKVPLEQVVAMLNEFHAQGVKQVYFDPDFDDADELYWSGVIPGMDVRELPYLPYPLKNYPTK
jgi:biopolymer transport protein ExbD